MLIVIIVVVVALACAMGGFIGGVYAEKYYGVPLWQYEDRWSIGIYTGNSPFKQGSPSNLSNPVLTARDVTDIQASFVADPFMVRENATWYMFLEVMPAKTYLGKIAVASSNDGWHWAYQRIVIDEPYHLSYPYVFKWENDYYMIPDCRGANAIRLYKAVDFPLRWLFVGTLLEGGYVDSSIFYHHDQWWILAANSESNDTLRLFQAKNLMGPWAEHPQSPIISNDARISRPGGRVLSYNGRLFRHTQDCATAYGTQLRAFEITELTPTSYQEREVTPSPFLQASGQGWNADGMHHIDPHQIGEGQWIACVDGNHRRRTFRLRW